MDAAYLQLCLALHGLEHTRVRHLSRLLLHFGGARALWDAGPGGWRSAGLPAPAVAELRRRREQLSAEAGGARVQQQLSALQRVGAGVLAVSDPEFPPLLREIHDPPPLLYYRGETSLLRESALAVVGARHASPVGVRAAAAFGAAAATAGLQVCSGLALGIDGAAHRGALQAGGGTIAVMATGIDRVYPGRHRQLAEDLLQRGCLVTEYPPGMPPLRANFPRRNRIISGLSLGVLVVEAAPQSGSLITARLALEQGREVFALPWSPFHATGRGCLRLLQEGAKMALDIDDVVVELGPLHEARRELSECGEAPGDAGQWAGGLLELIGCEAVTVDELVAHTALPVSRVLAELSDLELAGHVVRRDGGYSRA